MTGRELNSNSPKPRIYKSRPLSIFCRGTILSAVADYCALVLLLLITPISASFGQALNIQINGVLRDSITKTEIYRSNLLLPPDQSIEIFTGPYTIKLSAQKMPEDGYNISAELFGLGPDFHIAAYNLKIPVADSFPIPLQPVKGCDSIRYMISLLDDTSKVFVDAEPLDDTTAWGMSESIHYRTHWLKGSYADYLWNLKMGYLENVYDRYRSSFQLSSSDKIECFFHPDSRTSIYLDPRLGYTIQPRKWRVDLIFGRDTDVATPRPAAELLLYRHWGYGPRWMATGIAGYYEDNFLKMRKLASSFKPSKLAAKLANEFWVDTDTGRVVAGAFSRWLADKEIFSKFMELYKQSTSLNYTTEFGKIYGRSFENATAEFLDFIKSYQPKEVELEYYASEYLARGDYEQAIEYFREATQVPNGNPKFGNQLILSEYWFGDYNSASRDIGPDSLSPNCTSDILRMNLQVASGKSDPLLYKTHPTCSQAVEALTNYYLDQGQIDSANAIIHNIRDADKSSADYYLTLGRLRVTQGLHADTSLAMAAAVALGQAQSQPQEPVNYYMAGQAFLLMRKYGQAKQNLDLSNFLEKRPYFRGCTLLELGKLADLQSNRDEATGFYYDVLAIKAGAYQKSLAKKYLENRYELKY
jgi:tetratricopeptide (TPR) repeat protein